LGVDSWRSYFFALAILASIWHFKLIRLVRAESNAALGDLRLDRSGANVFWVVGRFKNAFSSQSVLSLTPSTLASVRGYVAVEWVLIAMFLLIAVGMLA
jgi:hypothetical protein